MKNYRPDNWEETKPKAVGEGYAIGAYNNGIEAGADAILNALTQGGYKLKKGQTITLIGSEPVSVSSNCHLVLIPEEG